MDMGAELACQGRWRSAGLTKTLPGIGGLCEIRCHCTDLGLHALHATLNLLADILDLLLHFSEFIKIHLPLNISLHIADITLCPANQRPERSRGHRQPLRAHHHQGNKADHNKFGESDIKHRLRGSEAQKHCGLEK